MKSTQLSSVERAAWKMQRIQKTHDNSLYCIGAVAATAIYAAWAALTILKMLGTSPLMRGISQS